MRVDVAASGTFFPVIFECHSLPFDNAHIENHSRLYHSREFRTANNLTILRVQKFIVTLLDKATSGAIFGIAVDYVVEFLTQ